MMTFREWYFKVFYPKWKDKQIDPHDVAQTAWNASHANYRADYERVANLDEYPLAWRCGDTGMVWHRSEEFCLHYYYKNRDEKMKLYGCGFVRLVPAGKLAHSHGVKKHQGGKDLGGRNDI